MFVSTIDMMLRRRFSALKVIALILGAACCAVANAQSGLFDATDVEYTAGVSGILLLLVSLKNAMIKPCC